eukprot:g18474.t1
MTTKEMRMLCSCCIAQLRQAPESSLTSLWAGAPVGSRRFQWRLGTMASLEGTWIVIGGAEKGGIIVREAEELSSLALEERLEYGALLQEISLSYAPHWSDSRKTTCKS